MMERTQPEHPDLEERRRNIAREYFDLIMSGRFREGLRFFAPDCVTHNPYFEGDMTALTEAMIAANKQGTEQYPNAELIVRHVMVDGDLVAVHTDLLNDRSAREQGGLRQVHLFRFDGDKIVEYWDITQQVMPNLANTSGAF